MVDGVGIVATHAATATSAVAKHAVATGTRIGTVSRPRRIFAVGGFCESLLVLEP